MARLTFLERQQLEKLFDMGGGYVLDFSNRTLAEFVADSVGKDIYDERYDYASGSKANRLRAFWKEETDEIVGTLINDLLKYAEFTNKAANPELIPACRMIVERLLTSTAATEQRLNASCDDRDTGSAKRERTAVRAFISYSWDSASHKDWVRNFAAKLSQNGIDIILDLYELPLGGDRFEFMEKSVRDANVVLCVCTPAYVAKANNRNRGVGVETALITPQFFDRVKNDKQFIPVIRESSPATPTTPDYMAALVFVDFRVDDDFPERMEELLRHLHRRPKYTKPRVGEAPLFKQTDSDDVDFSANDEIVSKIRGCPPIAPDADQLAGANLSSEGRTMVVEVAKDENGCLLYILTRSGTSFQAHGENLCPDQSPRTVAKWKGALDDLVAYKILEPRGQKNQVFALTAIGFQIADAIEGNT